MGHTTEKLKELFCKLCCSLYGLYRTALQDDKMVQLTKDQRVFVVLHYNRTGSLLSVQNAFRERFPDRNPPAKTTILKNVRKYNNHGTSLNRNKTNSGRPKTARSEVNIEAVRRLLEQNPEVSARRNPLNITSAGFNRITRLDLQWHPFRMHVRHELLANDYQRRTNFSHWFNQQCEEPQFLENLVIGDEATFSMNGVVNTQNVRHYAPKGNAPIFNFNKSDSRAKLSVWGAVCGNGVLLGPYFFERNVDGDEYLQMLRQYALPILAVHFQNQYENGVFRNLWWVQDGAPGHRRLDVRNMLSQVFPNDHVIGLGHYVEWPPRSPDLTPCDFFLWGYLKGKVFFRPPNNIAMLRQRIIEELNALHHNADFITRAVHHMRIRTTLCRHRNGGHVEGQGP